MIETNGPLEEEVLDFLEEKGEPATDAVSNALSYGIDVSLLESNLELSPQARLERHESALELVFELRKAGKSLSKA